MEEAVHIIKEKGAEADNNGKVDRILQGGQHPQQDENDVVGGISNGVAGAAAESKIGSHSAGRHRDGRGEQVRRVQCFQDKVKEKGDKKGSQNEKGNFRPPQRADLHLGGPSLIRVA